MKVELADVMSSEGMEMSEQVELGLSSFQSRLGRFPIVGKEPFTLQFFNEGGRKLRILGETDVTIAIPCSRCLKEVDWAFHIAVDKEISLVGEDGEADGSDCMAGTSLDADQLIFGEILVRWPMKVLCREDCKGICKRCGADLNIAECQCQKAEPDPRMAAIQDIFNKFKEV